MPKTSTSPVRLQTTLSAWPGAAWLEIAPGRHPPQRGSRRSGGGWLHGSARKRTWTTRSMVKLSIVELQRLRQEVAASWTATMARESMVATPCRRGPYRSSRTPIGRAARRARRDMGLCGWLRRAAARVELPNPLPGTLETGVWVTNTSMVLEIGTQMKSIKIHHGEEVEAVGRRARPSHRTTRDAASTAAAAADAWHARERPRAADGESRLSARQ